MTPSRALILTLLCFSSTWANADTFYSQAHWANTITLSTPLSGRVSSVKVKPGDSIKKGQLLLTLDPRLYQAASKRAKAQLQSARSHYDDIEREYSRAKELFERTVLSQTDLQTAETKFLSAQAQLNASQAAFQEARVNLEYTQLRAPFDGIVTGQTIAAHETVINSQQVTPMLRVSPGQSKQASFQVPAFVAAGLAPGETLNIQATGKALEASIQRLTLQQGHALVILELPADIDDNALVTLELP